MPQTRHQRRPLVLRRRKYAGATKSDLTRMRQLEAENDGLKRMHTDLALENAAMNDVIAKRH